LIVPRKGDAELVTDRLVVGGDDHQRLVGAREEILVWLEQKRHCQHKNESREY
jgi:hypothetical protein